MQCTPGEREMEVHHKGCPNETQVIASRYETLIFEVGRLPAVTPVVPPTQRNPLPKLKKKFATSKKGFRHKK